MPITGLDRMPGSGLARGTLFDKELNITTLSVATGTFSSSIILEASGENKYTITWTQPSGDDRALTIPAMSANDQFTFNDATQTLTNKTLTSPVITGGLNLSDANITNVGSIALDSLTSDGSEISFGSAGSGEDVYFYSATSGDHMLWDSSDEKLVIIGTDGANALEVSDGNVAITDNLTVGGDLTVSGTTTQINTTNLTVTDPLIKLAQGTTASPARDLGIIFTRGNGSASNIANRAILWDESADIFVFANTNDEDGTSTGNVDIDDYASIRVGAITADDNSTFTGTITAATGSTIGNLTLANGSITDSSGAIDFGNETLTTTGVVTAGGFTIGSAAILEAELEILDGATVTTTELNLIDGDTARGTTAIADGDGVLINDAGTMRMTTVETLAAYLDDEITAMPNLTTLAGLTTIGAVSNTLAMTFGDVTLYDDNNNADVSFKMGTGSAESLTIQVLNGGSNKTAEEVHFSTATASGTADHGKMVFDIDGTDIITIDDDGLVIKTTGTIGPVGDEDLLTLTASGSIVTVAGELSVTTLDIGGTNITSTAAELNYNDTGAAVGTVVASKTVTVDADKDVSSFRNITLTGELDAGSLDVSGDADIDGTLEADAITVDGTALNEYIADTIGAMVGSNTETGVAVTYEDGDNTLDFVLNAAQTTITSIYATDLIMGEDSQTAIDFGTANEIDFKVDNAARLTLTSGALYPVTNNQIDLGTASLEFKDAYFDGQVTADAFAGPLTGDVTGTADVATVATTVTITDNESTNEENAVVFTAGGDVDGGNLGLESDGNLTYNPSNGTLTATAFAGNLTGNVTGNASGTAATVTSGTQASITTVANVTTVGALDAGSITSGFGTIDTGSSTITTTGLISGGSLDIDDVLINGTTIGHTDDTDLITLADGNVTIAGELDLTTLDVSGNADIDGTLEADAITVDGTALNEYIADTVGAMVGSNTETNITVTYEDGDNTLDFVIGTLNQDTTGTADNITVSANNSANETVYPIFVDGATGSQGAESDTGLTYNPSTGVLTTTSVTGNLTGNVTGDVTGNVTGNTSGTAATVTGAAQSAITSLGTLTTLTVDDITINGSTISDSGALTVDIGGNIDLDTGGTEILLSSAGTQYGRIGVNHSDLSGGIILESTVSDKDVRIRGNDGGSMIDALHFDMSSNGGATFYSGANFTDRGSSAAVFRSSADAGDLFKIDVTTHGATTLTTIDDDAAAAHLHIDVDGSLKLDSNGNDIQLLNGGTQFGKLYTGGGGQLIIESTVSDQDMVFKGNDGGSASTTLMYFDVSEAGAATFTSSITATALDISGDMDIDGTSNLDAVDIDGDMRIDGLISVNKAAASNVQLEMKASSTGAPNVRLYATNDNLAWQIGATNTDAGYIELLDGGSSKAKIYPERTSYISNGDEGNYANLVLGHTDGLLPAGAKPQFQIIGETQNSASFGITRFSADTGGPQIFLSKSHDGTIGTYKNPTNGTNAGSIHWQSADDTDDDLLVEAAKIGVTYRETISASTDDQATASMEFYTNDSSREAAGKAGDGSALRMHITSTGGVQIGGEAVITQRVIGGGAQVNGRGLQVDGYDEYPGISITSWSADAKSPYFQLSSSNSNTPGTMTATDDGTSLGYIRFEGVDTTPRFDVGATIQSVQVGSAGARVPADLRFSTSTSSTPSEKMRIDTEGQVYIGDTANTGGGSTGVGVDGSSLTINMGANGSEILALKSSEIAHGMTGNYHAETDTFGSITKINDTAGGLNIKGFSETTRGLALGGYHVTDSTDHTVDANGCVLIRGFLKSSTTSTNPASGANILVLRGSSVDAGKVTHIFDSSGNTWFDGADQTAFDEHDDAQLVRAFDIATNKGVVQNKWDGFVKYNEQKLVDLNILGDTIDKGGLVNSSALLKLHNGAIWQSYVKQQEIKEKMDNLEKGVLQQILSKLEDLETDNKKLKQKLQAIGG